MSGFQVRGGADGARCSASLMRLLLVVLVLCVPMGCLVPRAPYEPTRYFRPDAGSLPASPTASQSSQVPARGPLFLRLSRVRAAAYLRDRIAWRKSSVEVGYYDLRRWTNPPEYFVERALERVLFEGGTLRRGAPGRAPSLAVEVEAFDELLQPQHQVRVELAVTLRSKDRASLLERTFTAERPVAGDDPGTMARAMGAALDEVVNEVVREVIAQLEREAQQ